MNINERILTPRNLQLISALLLTLCVLTISCTAQKGDNVTLIDKATCENMMTSDSNVQMVDVRTPEEFADGHIGEAVNIDFFSDDFVQRCEEEFDKEVPLIIYCQAGGRSAKAANKLNDAGFNILYDVKGGYGGWE